MDIKQKVKYEYALSYKTQKYDICVGYINLSCADPKSLTYAAEISLFDKYETRNIYIQFHDIIEFTNLLDDEIKKFMISSIYLKLNKENAW